MNRFWRGIASRCSKAQHGIIRGGTSICATRMVLQFWAYGVWQQDSMKTGCIEEHSEWALGGADSNFLGNSWHDTWSGMPPALYTTALMGLGTGMPEDLHIRVDLSVS